MRLPYMFRVSVTLAIVVLSTEANNEMIFRDGWIDFDKDGQRSIFEDPGQPLEKRVDDLIARMTFEEKLEQIRCVRTTNGFDPSRTRVGNVTVAAKFTPPKSNTLRLNEVQTQQISSHRLGIPLLFIDEALHGLRADQSTSYPQSIGLSSTWNPDLIYRVASAICAETKPRGIRQVLSPVVDIARDVRWGRTEETYGEDPYLVSRLAVEFCRAFEEKGVITTPKHFVANSGDGGRDSWAQYLDERILNEIYFPPYKACIEKAGARSIMPSYGSLGGIPTVSHPWLLNEVAREDWGFTGYYGSDFDAVTKLLDRHFITDDPSEVAAQCINAGMDVEWPRSVFYGAPLEEAIADGRVEKETIEEMARRMIRLKFEIGLFDEPFGDVELAVQNNGSEKHRELALETARQSLVLLKNENNTLPLDAKKVKKLLVVGARAEEVDLGGYSGTPKKLVSILEGLEHALPDTEVVFHPGVQSAPTPFMYMPKSMINEGLGFEAKFYENGELSTPSFTTHLEILRVRRFILRNHNYPKTVFSSEISGSFVSDQNRDAKLEIEATGEVQVFVNGEEILNNVGTIGEKDTRSDANFGELSGSIDQGLPKYSASYYFEKGSEYSIDVKWTNSDSDPTLFLRWDQRYGLDETIAEAVDLAKSSDAVVMVPSGIFEGEFQDRPNLDLPDEEEALIHALADSGTLLSVVLVNGSAITMMDWESRVPAILESWYSGQEGGNAIAEVLIGDYNPGGKLTITFPKYSWQCPLYYNYHPIGRSRGYQGPEKGKSLFPFGHGLSYTNFEYRDLSFSSKKINLDEGIDVSFKVKNTGRVKGDEVAQLYIWDEIASVVRPNKELKGFQRVTLEPGQEKLVTLHLSPEELSLWDREMNFKMEAGWTTVLVGGSSEDIRLRDRFEIVP